VSYGELLEAAKYMGIKGLVFKGEMTLITISGFTKQVSYGTYSK
jgi:hypothetical protein